MCAIGQIYPRLVPERRNRKLCSFCLYAGYLVCVMYHTHALDIDADWRREHPWVCHVVGTGLTLPQLSSFFALGKFQKYQCPDEKTSTTNAKPPTRLADHLDIGTTSLEVSFTDPRTMKLPDDGSGGFMCNLFPSLLDLKFFQIILEQSL